MESGKESFKPILLVDDNPVNQKAGEAILKNLGFTVCIAKNGQDALEAFSKQKFSVILMDCQMPVMDGFQASTAIRKLEALSGSYTPIIAVTALTMSGDRERCIAVGMDDYLSKPIDMGLLKLKLNHWLNAEVVYQSQKLSRKIMFADADSDPSKKDPIDLGELQDFYTSSQLDDLLGVFKTHSADMINRIQFFVKEKNSKSVAGLAHEMRSSCASIGAKQLARTCLILEQSAAQEDWIEANDALKMLQQSFVYLDSFLQNALADKKFSGKSSR